MENKTSVKIKNLCIYQCFVKLLQLKRNDPWLQLRNKSIHKLVLEFNWLVYGHKNWFRHGKIKDGPDG